VVNEEKGYVHRIEDFVFIDGVFETCQLFKEWGYKLVIVTNQSGIGRGLYSEADFQTLTQWMCDRFKEKGVVIDAVYYCPHHPTEALGSYRKTCKCRKPEPGMLLRAAREHDINLSQSIMVGDEEKDLLAGERAGVGLKILVKDGHDSTPVGSERADLVVESLGATEAFRRLIRQCSTPGSLRP
jgi:D-glycero-D-manno-heptose 1,7-bisphosphate phosphatase